MGKVKYYTEDELVEKMQSGEYNALDYINHHSAELVAEYEEFCKMRDKNICVESAEKFLNWRQREFDKAVERGDA